MRRRYTPDEALERLRAGNARFLRGEGRFPTARKKVLAALAHQQHPYVTLLGCSDSRVPPEILFDAGFGELFVVRLVGNVVSHEVYGSMQYAAVHLETPLFVVLGHEDCGAVQAALDAKFRGNRERSRIAALLANVLPGLEGIDPDLPPEEQLRSGVEANVRWAMQQIRDTPEAQVREAEGVLKLVGAVVELSTGVVRFLD
ncbi:MAG TPA: carbonic anhydrase [Myxococcaceae bacterium]|nr:carbonic anhydrase [Myxococcaceae bacterium]